MPKGKTLPFKCTMISVSNTCIVHLFLSFRVGTTQISTGSRQVFFACRNLAMSKYRRWSCNSLIQTHENKATNPNIHKHNLLGFQPLLLRLVYNAIVTKPEENMNIHNLLKEKNAFRNTADGSEIGLTSWYLIVSPMNFQGFSTIPGGFYRRISSTKKTVGK